MSRRMDLIKSSRLVISVFSLILTLIFVRDALSAYRIVFKNGSSIVVDSYKKVDGRIQFFRSGGMVEIDSADIVEIKETLSTYKEEGSERQEEEMAPASITPSSEDLSEDEIRKRLEEIQEEKKVLKKEAESVTEEIEKLNRDIKREGRVLAIRKKRELEKRKEELERRVSEINSRIEELQREEDGLLRRLWKY